MNKIILSIISLFLAVNGNAQDILLNELMSLNSSTVQDEDGEYPDWLEIYNPSEEVINMSGYSLTDEPGNPNKWTFPEIHIQPHDFLLVYASGKDKLEPPFLHTNFKISSEGESIMLYKQDGLLLDSLGAVPLQADRSYGRSEDGTEEWGIYIVPSPGFSNNLQSFEKGIEFSVPPGFYNETVQLTLNCEDTVYYTLDGETPDLNSLIFTESIQVTGDYPNRISQVRTSPIFYSEDDYHSQEFRWVAPGAYIRKARIVKARSFRNGLPSSQVYAATYFTNGDLFTFPVLSISTDSLNLFDYNSGIYLPGIHYDEDDIYWTGNYFERGMDWEKRASLDFFDENGYHQFSTDVGIRIHGQKSRVAPQKSLRLYARNEYGDSRIHYPFFKNREYDEFERLVLRSSYTYWWGRNTVFQDDLIHTHVHAQFPHMDVQLSAPAILFLNGEYWGIQNIRERQDEFYLESIYDIDKDSINIVQGNLIPEVGVADDYIDVLEFVRTHDLAIQENYNSLLLKIDIENYIDYLIIQLYFGNLDWPGNNMKMWKSNDPESKWKWMVYDMDATMSDYDENCIQRLYDINYPPLMFREMLNSLVFRQQFLDRFAQCLNTTFHHNIMIEVIDDFMTRYQHEISDHIERWGNPASYQDWTESVKHQVEYVAYRPCALKYQLIDFFDLDSFDFICTSSITGSGISLFPNPCDDFLRVIVELEVKENSNISVMDIQGRVVFKEILNDQLLMINTSAIPSGMYFIQYNDGVNIIVEKIMVN